MELRDSPYADEFTAPAGALTVLFTAGWSDREALLELLESSRYRGLRELVDARDGAGSAMPERLAFVRQTLERWLRDRPGGPLEIGPSGVEAIAAMACCWSVALTHALAEGVHTLTELDRKVESLYGEDIVLEHVEALVRTGQVETLRGESYGETRYVLTDWGREAIAPLIAAARYERHFPTDDVLAPDILDVEAAFQVVGPLLELPPGLQGACRLSVRLPGDEDLLAGATVEVREGRIASSSILLEQEPETWATGSPVEWCDAVVDPASGSLDMGGDTELARALLDALHRRLFDRS